MVLISAFIFSLFIKVSFVLLSLNSGIWCFVYECSPKTIENSCVSFTCFYRFKANRRPPPGGQQTGINSTLTCLLREICFYRCPNGSKAFVVKSYRSMCQQGEIFILKLREISATDFLLGYFKVIGIAFNVKNVRRLGVKSFFDVLVTWFTTYSVTHKTWPMKIRNPLFDIWNTLP